VKRNVLLLAALVTDGLSDQDSKLPVMKNVEINFKLLQLEKKN
jgi:hypothetical protein